MSHACSTTRINQFSARGSSIDELAAALSELCLQTQADVRGTDRVSYDIHTISAGPIAFIAADYDGDLTVWNPRPTETNIIILPLRGRCVVTTDGQQILSEGVRGVFVNSMSASRARFIGPRKHLGLRVAHEELTRRIGHRLNTSVRGSLDFLPEIDLSTGFGSHLMPLAALMYNGLVDGTLIRSPIALSNLTEATLELLIEAARHRYSSELHRVAEPPLPKTIKRAIDYMRAHIAQPISIEDIARACGVSPRTLQQGFRDFRHTTPFAFLQRLRLEAVHQELMAGEPGLSIGQAALKWGFVHRGRFSMEYRRRYGVLPSETLRMSTARSSDWS